MRVLRLLNLIAFATMLFCTLGAEAGVKSYREWKTEKIQSAQGKVLSTKGQIEVKKSSRTVALNVDPNMASRNTLESASSMDMSVEKLEARLTEEQYALEVARDLSVTDYFVGYLTKIHDKKSAYQEVAGKLSPEEVAELMTAYANSVFGTQTSDLPVSAVNVGKEALK